MYCYFLNATNYKSQMNFDYKLQNRNLQLIKQVTWITLHCQLYLNVKTHIKVIYESVTTIMVLTFYYSDTIYFSILTNFETYFNEFICSPKLVIYS